MAKKDTNHEIIIPSVLRKALEKNPVAFEIFYKLAYSHKREYINLITGAKKEETQKRIAAKTLEIFVGKEQ